ncbi:MAG TPA: hypothetical protein VIK71_01290 [Flavobacteriales bacterium]
MKYSFNQTFNDIRFARFISLGLGFLFLLIFYREVLFSPNSYLFNSTGDGIKNYFTYVAQIASPNIFQSSVMNYPYGEYFLYLDCHPILTIIIRAIPVVSQYSVGIVNLLMLLSMPLTAWLVTLILLRYRVQPLIAAISGFGIMVLSPQVFRMTGHYALSYSCFIPLTWYLYLQYKASSKKGKWSLILAFNSLFWFYIHGYMGMIAVAFVSCLAFMDWVLSWRHSREFYFRMWHMVVLSVLPLGLFYFLTKLGDSHSGRTENPYGFFEFTSNLESVIFPHHGPFVSFFQAYWQNPQIWEGWAYIGIGSMLALLLGGLFWLKLVVQQDEHSPFDSQHQIALILSAIILMLLAFGYPFIAGHESWLDKFSILKNFRGIGRFAWTSYFILTVLAVVLLQRMYERLQWRWLLVLPSVVAVLNVVEGWSYHQQIGEEVRATHNIFQRQYLSDEIIAALETVNWTQYQAMIPLPFFHIGSENYGKEANSATYTLSMLMCYHSGVPLMANYSTRTSIIESKKIMQIISPPFYYKAIQDDLPSQLPFIILDTKQEMNEWEQYLLNRGEVIYTCDAFRLLSIRYDALFSTDEQLWMDHYHNLKPQLMEKAGFELPIGDSAAYVYFNSWDELPSTYTLDGAGALSGQKKDYTLLKTFEENELDSGKSYVASFWMYNNGPNYGQDMPGIGIFVQTRKEDGSIEWHHFQGLNGALIIDGDWSLMEYEFTAPEGPCELYIKGEDFTDKPFYIDNLLIREKGTDVFMDKSSEGYLFMNNHRIRMVH